ncbi:MAG TPA: M23 family metallopeptidase [Gemmatimonadaceae bacterium]|nr:M23 family metallopeptidase [Gemmatimonadaceae bacterium]
MAWRTRLASRFGCGHWHRIVAALALLGACTRPRLPINPAPTTSPSPARNEPQPKTAAEPVPLATVATLGSVDADAEYLKSRRLLLPVAGVRPDQLADSFEEPRDGTRRHRAIDILAPRGTPVLAADDGHVLRVSWNSAGGNTVYATDSESRVVYYYAHLDHYHEPIAAGMPLAKGDTIGFVGTTGNAPKDIPHLHFQVMRMPHDGKYWNGEPINPFPILRSEGERP